MVLDLKKLSGGTPPGGGKIVEPWKIFTTLARDPRFRRPSDEQGEVLDQWFKNRNRADNTIKMNTGSGKTLVGLLALQSSVNEGIFPAVYVTPDTYLASQAMAEAKSLGISVTDDPRSHVYLSGRAILITTVQRVINGRSIFGVGTEGQKLPIGAIVIDDAHACLAVVNDQFKLTISSDHAAYAALLKLFFDDLKGQTETGVLDIQAEDPQAIVPVPFWAWKGKQSDVVKVLHNHREDEKFRFVWPLIVDVLSLCQCVFGGRRLEIAPRCLPIDEIPSFVSAKRRIYMTATLADDGVLISHFKADPDAVQSAIKPKGVGEIGDRMILAPQEINPEITFDEIKSLVIEAAKKHNVVVIVPSKKRAGLWDDSAAQTLDASNIEDGVAKLKRGGHVGLTVMINKYDGVDLPGDACRLLVIDGLPEVFSLIERTEMAILEGTEVELVRQIQRLEQGMGRGVRSGEDHCAVLLVGSRLVQRIHMPAARAKFTPATLAQLDLSREVADQLRGQPITEFRAVLDFCLLRNSDWWRTGRERLANAPEGTGSFVDSNVVSIRKAFDFARVTRFDKSGHELQKTIDGTSELPVRGYLKQQLAEYEHHLDAKKAQETMLSAYQDNRRLSKPITGITYSRLSATRAEQAEEAAQFMTRFLDGNDLVIFVNALLSDLDWYEDDAKRFESAIRELGAFLGFGSQRPEVEIGKGPDNLWAVGALRFFVIEAKNGATNLVISKHDCNQLLGSVEWFQQAYDGTCKSIPILIHPSIKFDKYSSPSMDFRVMEKEGLAKLKLKLKEYAAAMATSGRLADRKFIADRLKAHDLTADNFVAAFTKKFTKEK